MLYVKEIIRPKYALKDSTLLPPAGQKGVEIAPMPLMPVDKCIADSSLLAEILLQKFAECLQKNKNWILVSYFYFF